MAAQIRELTDDVVIMYKGDSMPVQAGPLLRQSGWRGGTWVKFVEPEGIDEFVVEASDGNGVAGMIPFPSESYNVSEDPDGATQNWTAHQWRTDQGSAAGASTITLMAGNARLLFKYFETTALDGAGDRVGGAIIYTLNEPLYISENGLLCNDTVAHLISAGVDLPVQVGICSAVPAARNGVRLGLDTRL